MAFSIDETAWDTFLAEWPLERLRTMALADYTSAGDKHCFVHWIESGLDQYGSIWGGSAFKFGIYSRHDATAKEGDTALAYDDSYGWYRRFGETHDKAFETVRAEVTAVAEAARAGRLEDIDKSELGPSYRWKIAFHYQDRTQPVLLPCVFLRKPLLNACGLASGETSLPLSELYRRTAALRSPEESLMAFSHRIWRDWVMSTPLRVRLTEGAVRNGYIPINLISAPFPETIRGGANDRDAGEPVPFRTDTGWTFESDVRAPNSDSGRIRARFTRYFGERHVQPGDVIEIQPDEAGVYLITHHPKGDVPPAHVASPAAAGLASVKEPVPEYTTMSVNRILYGPPGTGKTYRTVNEALRILAPIFLAENEADRGALKRRFDALAQAGLIRFVTFHQSFSYEDFVEGIRAETKDEKLQYRVVPGVFREICEDASGSVQVASELGVREDARIWKISIDGTSAPNATRNYCFVHGEARIGWYKTGNLRNEQLAEVPGYAELGPNDRNTLRVFSRDIEPGDVLLCIGSDVEVQAIGVVQGEYEFQPQPPAGVREDYGNVLPVKWLTTGLELDIRRINGGRRFVQKTVYELTRFGWAELADYLQDAGIQLEGVEPAPQSMATPHVLIIDEINRGNISRIFGELITLIEPSKRKGESEALEVVLPYSKRKFSVPRNVHLIGTMNTADRSLAGLDVALRRRFEFVEMLPDADALAGVVVAGVHVDELLSTMNQRIEILLGRDYMLGHAYFMRLKESPTLDTLAEVFRRQVLPLLQEYFFEDWQKIAWVLNDHRKPAELRFLRQATTGVAELLGDDVDLPSEGRVWTINTESFDKPDAYLAIIKAPQVAA
ncbi:MAG TPA: AAA family ATPase [Rhodanobacter sp.]